MLELGQVDEAYEKLNNLPEEYKNFLVIILLQAQYYYSSKDFDKALACIDEYDKGITKFSAYLSDESTCL